jgi:hypothetical protein
MGGRIAGFVYFIAAETVGAVKIGFSRNHPRARLKHLQIGCPVPLKLLSFTEGTNDDELRLHASYSDLRIHGEWFRLEGRLIDVVRDLPPPADPHPVILPQCPVCGEKASPGYNHLVGRGITKICSGMRHLERVK